ncbi:hypothetical protein AAZV13_09G049150 [Glycine max]|uniref:Uncharacterized protein n=1 Tax=Glycine max TaxID=3847 RepID=C6T2L3_SOYBN|nr:unknown [Glycine max]
MKNFFKFFLWYFLLLILFCLLNLRSPLHHLGWEEAVSHHLVKTRNLFCLLNFPCCPWHHLGWEEAVSHYLVKTRNLFCLLNFPCCPWHHQGWEEAVSHHLVKTGNLFCL